MMVNSDHGFNERIKKMKTSKGKLRYAIRGSGRYEIPPILECKMDNDTIKCLIRRKAQLELWEESKEGKFSVPRGMPKVKNKPYHRFNRLEGRAILLWRCGMLKFRRYQREYYEKRRQDTSCPFLFCTEEDTMSHALECKFSNVKLQQWFPGSVEDERMIEFILKLNKERLKLERALL